MIFPLTYWLKWSWSFDHVLVDYYTTVKSFIQNNWETQLCWNKTAVNVEIYSLTFISLGPTSHIRCRLEENWKKEQFCISCLHGCNPLTISLLMIWSLFSSFVSNPNKLRRNLPKLHTINRKSQRKWQNSPIISGEKHEIKEMLTLSRKRLVLWPWLRPAHTRAPRAKLERSLYGYLK